MLCHGVCHYGTNPVESCATLILDSKCTYFMQIRLINVNNSSASQKKAIAWAKQWTQSQAYTGRQE
jgi:hypothetical protein